MLNWQGCLNEGVLAWPTHASIWKEYVNVIVIKLSTRYINRAMAITIEQHETGFGDMKWDKWGRVYAALPNENEALSTLHLQATNTVDYASHFSDAQSSLGAIVIR